MKRALLIFLNALGLCFMILLLFSVFFVQTVIPVGLIYWVTSQNPLLLSLVFFVIGLTELIWTGRDRYGSMSNAMVARPRFISVVRYVFGPLTILMGIIPLFNTLKELIPYLDPHTLPGLIIATAMFLISLFILSQRPRVVI